MAKTPTSAPGNKSAARSGCKPGARAGVRSGVRSGRIAPGTARIPGAGRQRERARHGFTLVELLVVLSLIAIASGIAVLALRDPARSLLDREAARIAALLEAARVESRSSGVAVRFELDGPSRFRLVGTPAAAALSGAWLGADTRAEIIGAPALALGPEPILAAEGLRLRAGDAAVVVATDGIAPFTAGAPPR